MTFEDYHREAVGLAIYPNRGSNIVYPVLGLVGESGEVAEKVKKVFRDGDGDFGSRVVRERLLRELGDVLWYLAACSDELGADLETVAELNLSKLRSRKDRGTLHGDGDDR